MSSEDTTVFSTTVPPHGATAVQADTSRGRWRDSLLVLLWSTVLALLAFLPLLGGRGVALVGEMVFVPRQPFKGAWLGLDGGSTAAVPADFLVSLLTTLVPGDLLQKVVLLSIVIVAGTGAGAAVSHLGLSPRLAAATLYAWNPFTFERLAVGDWTLLAGYAVLPWIVWAARRTVTGGVGEWAPVVVFIAFAGWLNPIGGVLALLLGVILLAGRNARAALIVLAAGIVVNLPTIVPALLRRGGATVDPATVGAHALSSEGGLGLFGNLLTLGGIWDESALSPGRANVIVVVLAVLLTAAALAGAALLARRADGGIVTGIGLLAAIGVVIALLGAFDGTRGVLESLADSVPGGALLADGHAWLAPLALLLAVGLAGLVKEVQGRAPGSGAVVAAAVVAVAAPLALLPSMALGLDGRLENARYPGEWWQARQAIEELDPSGVAVLPFAAQREFGFNERRASDDPATRYFPGDIVVDDTVVAGGVEVEGSDPRVAAIRAALDGPASELAGALAANGIDAVVVERNLAGGVPRLATLGGDEVFSGSRLTVLSLPDAATEPDRPAAAVIIIADILAALVALGALGAWVVRGRRRHDDPVAANPTASPTGGTAPV